MIDKAFSLEPYDVIGVELADGTDFDLWFAVDGSDATAVWQGTEDRLSIDLPTNPEWKKRLVQRIATVTGQDTRHRPLRLARLWLEGKRPHLSHVEKWNRFAPLDRDGQPWLRHAIPRMDADGRWLR